ncbi:Protein of unknown function [Bacillus toyonensis]|nr:Protein of unknown function [Bacillus toyonensis]
MYEWNDFFAYTFVHFLPVVHVQIR